MPKVFNFSIHTVDRELKPVVFEGVAASIDRLQRCMSRAVQLDAVFTFFGTDVEPEVYEAYRASDLQQFKKCGHWSFGLPQILG